VVTSTTGGSRSGRERKANTPSGGGNGTPGKGLTFGAREELTFEERSGGSQPTVPVNARYAAPVLTAVRNRRRVNLEPNADALHREREWPREALERSGPLKMPSQRRMGDVLGCHRILPGSLYHGLPVCTMRDPDAPSIVKQSVNFNDRTPGDPSPTRSPKFLGELPRRICVLWRQRRVGRNNESDTSLRLDRCVARYCACGSARAADSLGVSHGI
jgi:hypothetical protein